MPKRPRNPSGTVRKRLTRRGEVHWQGIVQYWDVEADRRRQNSETFDHRAPAVAWVAATLVEHRRPTYRQPSGETETLGTYLDSWLDEVAHRVRPSTLRSYRYALAHVHKALGNMPLAALTPAIVQALYADLLKTASPTHVHYVHSVLRHALSDAEAQDLIVSNPVRRARPPRVEPPSLTVPTADEARRLVAAATGHRLFPLWATLAVTGARLGEVLGLRWTDVDLDRRLLVIQQTLSGAGSRRHVGPVKSRAGARTLALDPWLVRVLAERQRYQAEERRAADEAWRESGLMFTTRRGTPLDPRNVERDFKAVLAAAGLPRDIRIHDLRHSMATTWLAAGEHALVVSQRLGHSSVAFTLQRYGHVIPGAEADAAVRQGQEWGRVITPSSGAQTTEENTGTAENAKTPTALFDATLENEANHRNSSAVDS